MQGSWKEQLKQKFRNGRRVDPSDARDKDNENSQPNHQDDASEPPWPAKGRDQLVNPGLLQKVCGIICVIHRIPQLLK